MLLNIHSYYSLRYATLSIGSTFGTNNISQYQREVQEVCCSTGVVISTVYTEAMITPPASGLVSGIGFNSLDIGGTGYFLTQVGKCFKFTVNAVNACGVTCYRGGEDCTLTGSR